MHLPNDSAGLRKRITGKDVSHAVTCRVQQDRLWEYQMLKDTLKKNFMMKYKPSIFMHGGYFDLASIKGEYIKIHEHSKF